MRRIIFLLCTSLFLACTPVPKITMTPLEIQNMQTREYQNPLKVVFPSVISVFQDLGYTIKSADKETGLITAESAARSDSMSRIWLGVSNVTQTSATAFIEEIGKVTRVRINFVNVDTQSFHYGQTDRQDTPILDQKIYTNAFEKIENAIFMRAGK